MTTVVRLVTRLNVGGPARQALLLSRELNDEFPTLLATGNPDPSEGELSDSDVCVARVPLVRAINARSDLRGFLAVRNLLARHRPRILHTHMAKAGTIGRLAARSLKGRTRTVHTFHGHVLDGYFSKPLQTSFMMIERSLARTTDVLVAVSPETRDALLDLGIGRPSQYHVLPVGIDLEPYLAVSSATGQLRSDLGLCPNIPLIGMIGRLVPIKDHSTLLQAMLDLPDAHLAVVGDGELRDDLEAEAAGLGLQNRVHFTGWRHDLAADIADLDVVVLTSRNEGTPVALIEALAAARPVVATDVGGVKSVVKHGTSGLLAPAGESTAIAGLVQRLLKDRSEAARMGAAGRRHVEQTFGARRLVEAIRELYRGLL